MVILMATLRGNGLNKVFINFAPVAHKTLSDVFGPGEVSIATMLKMLWAFIRLHSLKRVQR